MKTSFWVNIIAFVTMIILLISVIILLDNLPTRGAEFTDLGKGMLMIVLSFFFVAAWTVNVITSIFNLKIYEKKAFFIISLGVSLVLLLIFIVATINVNL